MVCSQLDSSPSTSSISCPLPASHRLSISLDVWREAEERIEEMLCVFQPFIISQDRRNEVIEYIQRVIGSYLGAEIFPVGSVPLRTYLPDGDIDLSVICNQNAVDDLVRQLCNMVDDRCKDPEFLIKDIQVVEAQVKIVKFMVKGIALDLSFNQVAGIGALCLLEQVDRVIGRDHFLKRSIILIKAWCLYESRILGAHNGLISSYGLEIMVLYIINVFHSSLDGPLSVLYRFLDYFREFDWQSYCLSIHGPVPISALPNAEPLGNDNSELLLGKEFVDSCKELFSNLIPEIEPRPFQVKNLNIVDPLKDNNNLGRSVSKGNFLRIKFAFSYGAQKISEILKLPMGKVGQELENFFKNTLDRNGRGERPDVEGLVPVFGTGRFVTPSLDGDIDCFYNNLMYSRSHLGGLASAEQNSSLSLGNRKILRGRDSFVPRHCPMEAWVPRIGPSVVGEPLRSKGTGTFIPIARNLDNRCALRRTHVWMRAKNIAEPSNVNPSTEVAEVPNKEQRKELSHYSPNTNLVVSEDEIQRTSRRSMGSSQVGTCRDSKRVKGRFLPDINEEDETSLVTCGSSTLELEESNSTCEKSLPKPYQLEDDVDFPPLSL